MHVNEKVNRNRLTKTVGVRNVGNRGIVYLILTVSFWGKDVITPAVKVEYHYPVKPGFDSSKTVSTEVVAAMMKAIECDAFCRNPVYMGNFTSSRSIPPVMVDHGTEVPPVNHWEEALRKFGFLE